MVIGDDEDNSGDDDDGRDNNDEECRLGDTDPETFQWIPSHRAGKTIVGHWTAQLSKFSQ